MIKMCGISGSFSKSDTLKMMECMENRGPDGKHIKEFYNFFVGHNLLSIIDIVKQPIYDEKNLIVTNCEIYNWKEIKEKYKINAKNDAELLFEIIKKNKTKKKLINILKEIDGVYAFAFLFYEKDCLNCILCRDFFGEKPLWYAKNKDNFYFASEKKAIPEDFQKIAMDLNPRNIIFFNLTKNKEYKQYKGFYNPKTSANNDIDFNNAKVKIENLLNKSIEKRIDTDKKIGILVSGGVDSSLIAKIISKYKNVICYNVSLEDGEDRKFAKILENRENLKFEFITPKKEEILEELPNICKTIESSNPVKVSVAIPFYFAAKKAKEDGIKIMFLGSGADDVFCGYSRFDSNYSATKDSISKLRKIYDDDLYRDDLIFMKFGIECRLPYLDKELVDFCISIKDEFKINENERKIILREVAKNYLPKEIYLRPKKAAQYGSKMNSILIELSKNYKNRGEFLKKYFNSCESNLGCLFSGGKDSTLALHIMKNMNYNIECLIAIDSKNKDSYMYHTPLINLTKLQAKSMNIPLIISKSFGEKENELKDLKKALKLAVKKYNINGIITGALFSTYQRDRIEEIADEIGLKVFSPLWHADQYNELKQVIDFNIKAIIVKVAAKGLDKKDIGQEIDKNMLEKFNNMNKDYGFNIAGEGGEYETFVIDAPMFKNSIKLEKYDIINLGYDSFEIDVKKITFK